MNGVWTECPVSRCLTNAKDLKKTQKVIMRRKKDLVEARLRLHGGGKNKTLSDQDHASARIAECCCLSRSFTVAPMVEDPMLMAQELCAYWKGTEPCLLESWLLAKGIVHSHRQRL